MEKNGGLEPELRKKAGARSLNAGLEPEPRKKPRHRLLKDLNIPSRHKAIKGQVPF